MANRWCDGFGRYGGTKAYMLNGSSGQAWAQADVDISLSNANPRTGSWHMRLGQANSGTNEARRVFGAPLTEVFVGFAVYCQSLPTSESQGTTGGGVYGIYLCAFRDQANQAQCRVLLGTDGALELRRGTVVLGRTLPIIGAGAYQHIEIYAKAHATLGAIEIRVDQVTKLNLTGINTIGSGAVEFSQFAAGHETAGGTAVIDFADVYCNDTVNDSSGCHTFIGDVKSGDLPVNADTAQAGFVLSSGVSGFALLNERPPNDANYVSTTATIAQSNFGLQDGPANLSEILTVRPWVRALKDDAGTCLIAPSMISNAIKAVVTAQPITTAAAYYDSNVPMNPNTAAPWTAAALAAGLHVTERTA